MTSTSLIDTKSPNKTACVDNGKHKWQVARIRGTKVRHQCAKCLHMDRWVQTANSGKVTVQKNSKPQPVNATKQNSFTDEPGKVTKLTGSNSVHEHLGDSTSQIFKDYAATLTVTELREKAKKHGLTGYSKMKKDDLITALTTAQPVQTA